MRTISEFQNHARECRELAKLVRKLEDKYALDRAAQGWDNLAKLHSANSLQHKTRGIFPAYNDCLLYTSDAADE